MQTAKKNKRGNSIDGDREKLRKNVYEKPQFTSMLK